MRVVLNPFCLLYFQLDSCSALQGSCSPTDQHMACISASTGSFWQQSCFLAAGEGVVFKQVLFRQMALEVGGVAENFHFWQGDDFPLDTRCGTVGQGLHLFLS